MSLRDPGLLLEDMIEAIDKALSYIDTMPYEEFLEDTKTQDAVIRNIQIVGEASNRMPEDIRLRFPEIEWKKIARSRHVLVHDYFSTDFEIIWRILTVHFPQLRIDLIKVHRSL